MKLPGFMMLLTLTCISRFSIADAEDGVAASLTWAEEAADSCVRKPITTDDLLEIRELGGMAGNGLSVSGDGQHFAAEVHRANVANNAYDVAWVIGPTAPGGEPALVDDGGEAALFKSRLSNGRLVGAWLSEYAKWSPDSSGIAYRKRLAGETQLWLSSRDGDTNRPLTDNAADIGEFAWNEDGSKIYFHTDADRRELEQLGSARYRHGYVYDHQQDWSVIDGRPLYAPYGLTRGAPRIWVLHLETGEERLLRDTADVAAYEALLEARAGSAPVPEARQAVHTTDGRGIAWLVPADSDKQGMYPPMALYASRDPDASNPVRCEAQECTGVFDTDRLLRNGLSWHALTDEIYFVRKEGVGYSRRALYGWRVGSGTVRKVLSTSDWISDCTVAENRAICFRETPVHPRSVIAIDLKDGSIETLLDPNPAFKCFILADVELLEWDDGTGYGGAYGYLLTPPNHRPGTRYPLVIVGYRARYVLRGGVGEEYPGHALANNGFIVLVYDKPTTYKALESHTDPVAIGKAAWGTDLFDVTKPLSVFEMAIRSLSEQGLVDPARVAITGLSNGVGHVNYALTHSRLFAAAITSSFEFTPTGWALTGVSDEAAKEYRRAIGAGRYPGPDGFLLPHVSLGLNANRMTTPLLVNISDHEHVWGMEEVVALTEAGAPVEMVVYPDEGHIKWHPAHRASVYERNIDWLKFWLLSIEDSDPTKQEQYGRWRKLRRQNASHPADGS